MTDHRIRSSLHPADRCRPERPHSHGNPPGRGRHQDVHDRPARRSFGARAGVGPDRLHPAGLSPVVFLEYNAQATDGRFLVVVRPKDEWTYEDFRVFFGPSDRVAQRHVAKSVTRPRRRVDEHYLRRRWCVGNRHLSRSRRRPRVRARACHARRRVRHASPHATADRRAAQQPRVPVLAALTPLHLPRVANPFRHAGGESSKNWSSAERCSALEQSDVDSSSCSPLPPRATKGIRSRGSWPSTSPWSAMISPPNSSSRSGCSS